MEYDDAVDSVSRVPAVSAARAVGDNFTVRGPSRVFV
jgi:hypothetical protein